MKYVLAIAAVSSLVMLKAQIVTLQQQLAQTDAARAVCQAQLVSSKMPSEREAIEQEANCQNGFDWSTFACKAE